MAIKANRTEIRQNNLARLICTVTVLGCDNFSLISQKCDNFNNLINFDTKKSS